MANFYTDNEDLRWYIEHGIDWSELVRTTEADFRNPGGPKSVDEALAFYKETLEMVGGFVADEIAPHAAQLDKEGVRHEGGEAVFPERLAGIFAQINELGLHGLCVPRELGGMNAPVMLYFLLSELFGRADVSVMAHHGFHGGMAMAMLLFSVREGTTKIDPDKGTVEETRFADFIGEIVRGEAWGCMDITEPDAGSDMARLRTRAEQDADGNWFVTGQKIFITSGHGKYHFVIARTEAVKDPNDPLSGLSGLSMFLVPTYLDGPEGRKRIVGLGRIEEKLGHHASVTAQLDFERAPAMLIGERGQGFEYMLLLMNNARLGVGFECLGLQEAAVRLAAAYAAERKSMGKSIDKHEMIADYLDEMGTDAQALRALCVHGAYHEELTQKKILVVKYGNLPDSDKAGLEREIVRHKRLARRVTPLLKYFGAEKAVESARRCVQIHGGVGYTKDFGAEKLLRDAMVMPIYEGTSQIQALMAMKDTLGGILKNPQRFVRRGAQARWRSLSSRDGLERAVARIQSLSFSAQQHLILRTAGDKLKATAQKPIAEWPRQFLKNWNPKRDFAYAMLHAERLTRLLVDEVVAELFLEQAKKDPSRRAIAERWVERAEPRCRYILDEITSTGDRLLATLRQDAEVAKVAEEENRMSVPLKFIRYQGPVLRGMGEAAVGALRQRIGKKQNGAAPHAEPTLPGREHHLTVSPRPAELVNAYVRWVGGDPSSYKGRVPAHLFPQWGFPLTGKMVEGLTYPMLAAMNGGCKLTINAQLPAGEPLEVSGRLDAIDDNGTRAILDQKLVTGTRANPEAVVAHLYVFIPLKKDDKKSGKKTEKARVPVDAREIAFFKLKPDAGLDFAKLTGDFNPVHWVPRWAKAFGFRNVILHGFGTLARAIEALNRGLFAGDVTALREIDVRFTRPLVLPARVGVYVRGDKVWVGDAPGGPAYLEGTFKLRNQGQA